MKEKIDNNYQDRSSKRDIPKEDIRGFKIGLGRKNVFKKVLRWELILVVMLLALNIINSNISENYLKFNNITGTLKMFLDKGIVAIPMIMVLLLGEIDISVSSIMTLSSVLMGLAGTNNMPLAVVLMVGLFSGSCCGFINGVLIAKFPELSSTIITLGNMIFYRGIAYMILENRAYVKYSPGMRFFSWGNIFNIPFIFIVFIIEAIVFTFIIHRTRFGRSLYAIGSNSVASYFSGIRIERLKIIVFVLNGFFSGLAAMFLVSKLGSARANMAIGFEMEIIAMVILGGVSVSGGIGTVPGVIISVFIIGLLRFGLGIAFVSTETIMIIIGLLLILSVSLPNIIVFFSGSFLVQWIKKKLSLSFFAAKKM
jgi:rhamnose transport system permease protein